MMMNRGTGRERQPGSGAGKTARRWIVGIVILVGAVVSVGLAWQGFNETEGVPVEARSTAAWDFNDPSPAESASRPEARAEHCASAQIPSDAEALGIRDSGSIVCVAVQKSRGRGDDGVLARHTVFLDGGAVVSYDIDSCSEPNVGRALQFGFSENEPQPGVVTVYGSVPIDMEEVSMEMADGSSVIAATVPSPTGAVAYYAFRASAPPSPAALQRLAIATNEPAAAIPEGCE